MNNKTIEHIEVELKRFSDRLAEVKKLENEPGYFYATRKHGAMRRAAHDLKEALTLVTQNKDLL